MESVSERGSSVTRNDDVRRESVDHGASAAPGIETNMDTGDIGPAVTNSRQTEQQMQERFNSRLWAE